MVVEPGRLLTQLVGDLLGRSGPLSEALEDSLAERMGEGLDLLDRTDDEGLGAIVILARWLAGAA